MVFKTSLGQCQLTWNKIGLTKVLFAQTKPRPKVVKENPPPKWIQDLVKMIQDHLAGNAQDFSQVPLDLTSFSPFFKKIYQLTQKIPSGQTKTYGELAAHAKSPMAARAVGMAMARNPFPIVVPCHRVLGKNKKLTGFSLLGGIKTKEKLLKLESN
jgi:methylated-DNA-[protein]-cysteine S-methyltransferase